MKLYLGGTQMYTFDDCIVQSASAPRPAMDHGSPYVYHLTVYRLYCWNCTLYAIYGVFLRVHLLQA